MSREGRDLTLNDLALCFEGAVPAVIATASADGAPNVTYLSRVRIVDGERLALSNQFLSKTARNLTENPRASVLVLDPTNYDEFRLSLVYERTERRGALFDRLRDDVDAIAALTGMQDVFRLRAADIYRVIDIAHVPAAVHRADPGDSGEDRVRRQPPSPEAVAALAARVARCGDLDTLVSATVDGMADLLGYEHVQLLVAEGDRLVTIASRGYPSEGVGSEVPVGEGAVGVAALRCSPVRIGNLRQMGKYARSVRRGYEGHGDLSAAREVPLPGLDGVESQLAVPAMALGQLVGVLVAESRDAVAFGPGDEAVLSVVASLVAAAIEAVRAEDVVESSPPPMTGTSSAERAPAPAVGATKVRFFDSDGSVFLDADYLIKGVAGRILWWLVRAHLADGRTEFTNKEVRVSPEIELPEYRDNLESRLILLKRRLDERCAPVRIERTGRGRFRLVVTAPITVEPSG
ncbi:MAG: pyridoxamine 5'-phosphate oxidase family protein [Acidimicrobiales bacterium]